MGKLLQCHFKGKTCSKLANGLNLYDLKKKLTPEVALCPGVIYMYITILVKQVYWYISQVSVVRLQDHWSSGYYIQTRNNVLFILRTCFPDELCIFVALV